MKDNINPISRFAGYVLHNLAPKPEGSLVEIYEDELPELGLTVKQFNKILDYFQDAKALQIRRVDYGTREKLPTNPKAARLIGSPSGIHSIPVYSLGVDIGKLQSLNPAVYVVYDPDTGVGSIAGESFKLKRGMADFALLPELLKQHGRPLGKDQVLGLILRDRKRGDVNIMGQDKISHDSQMSLIRETVKEMRAKFGFTPNQLIINEGSLALVAVEIDF